MSSFAVRTNVRDLIVTIESIERGVCDIFIYGMNYTPGRDEYYNLREPSFYLEHVRRNVRATFTDILEEVKRGVNYHFIWDNISQKEFKEWLETRLFTQDILVDMHGEYYDYMKRIGR